MNIKLSLRLANHLFQHPNGEISVRNNGKTITQKRNTACVNPKPNIMIWGEIAAGITARDARNGAHFPCYFEI